MCGIVGLLVKRDELRERLGQLLTPMIDCMATRGPDSAGLAVFHEPLDDDHRRFGLYAKDRRFDWRIFQDDFERETGGKGRLNVVENHAAVISDIAVEAFKSWLAQSYPSLHLLSVGRAIDVYKDDGPPDEIARRYRFSELKGTHAVGHTRMATESAVSPALLWPEVVRSGYLRVAAGVAAADKSFFEHSNIVDAVFLCEVISGGQSMTTGAESAWPTSIL